MQPNDGSVAIGGRLTGADADVKLQVTGNVKVTGTVVGNMKVVYQRDDQPVSSYEKPNWRYHMSLTASAYFGRTKTIPNEVLTALCGKPDGCEVRLGMTRWDDDTQTAAASHRFLLYYDSTSKRWKADTEAEGIVGNGATEHIVAIFETCFLTDGTYNNNRDMGDQNTGVQLLVGDKHKNSARTCELTLIP